MSRRVTLSAVCIAGAVFGSFLGGCASSSSEMTASRQRVAIPWTGEAQPVIASAPPTAALLGAYDSYGTAVYDYYLAHVGDQFPADTQVAEVDTDR